MLFSSWSDLFRITISALACYVCLVLLLRLSGNRTLSKMNSFDFVITIALGSTLSSGILQKSLSISDIVLALALLIAFQYAITWLSVRSDFISKALKTEPKMVFRRGQPLPQAMKSARVTVEEIDSAIREHGFTSRANVEAVVLESNGQLSVIGSSSR